MQSARDPVEANMLDRLIKFFVYKTKGHITKTQLVKFLYLADLYAVKWTGKQLTDLDWYYYLRGPWHEEIDSALSKMEGREICLQSKGKTTLVGLGPEADPSEALGFPCSLEFVLENIRREWAGSDTIEDLLNYVYATAPMIEARAKHRPEEKARLDLNKEREKLLAELG